MTIWMFLYTYKYYAWKYIDTYTDCNQILPAWVCGDRNLNISWKISGCHSRAGEDLSLMGFALYRLGNYLPVDMA
jgi:hypothetical protein